MKIKLIPITIACSVAATGVYAQSKNAKDTAMKANTIEVIQTYKPEVKQAPKPEFTPALPPVDTSRPSFKYDVPAQTLYFTYHSSPLKPLALGRDTTPAPFANYVKLGGGNLSTAAVDAGFYGLKGDNYETAFHLNHLSQKGKLENQKSATTVLDGSGLYHTNGHTLSADVSLQRNRNYLYGDNADDFHPKVKMDGGRITLGAQNDEPSYFGITYRPQLMFSYFYGTELNSEASMGVNLPFYKEVDTSLQLEFAVNGMLSKMKTTWGSVNNNVLQLRPGMHFHKNGFAASAFLNPTFGANGKSYLLPELTARYGLPGLPFTVKAGWVATLYQNRYEQVFQKNPFFAFNNVPFFFDHKQTKTTEVYGGVETHIGHHIFLSGKVNWQQYNNLPLFVGSVAAQNEFITVYDDKVQSIGLEANIRYQIGNSVSAGFSGIWTNYYTHSFAHVWQEPGIRLKGDLMFRPFKDLTVTAYANILDQMYAQNSEGNSVKMKGIFDLGAGTEYQIIPRLSAYLQVNNLLNQEYQRWYGYPSYGFNIYGGIRFKF